MNQNEDNCSGGRNQEYLPHPFRHREPLERQILRIAGDKIKDVEDRSQKVKLVLINMRVMPAHT